MAESFDVVVIGGGTAGLVTASGCARLGRRVAVIEREALGGDCLWSGCVPTKSLVASARVAHHMRTAAEFGLPPAEPAISSGVLHSMRQVQHIVSRHDAPDKFRKLGIDVIEGSARLAAHNEVRVGSRQLRAKQIVIATGSRTRLPDVAGLGDVPFFDHATFLRQDSIPRSVTILGGGAIGTEFAQIFRRLGARVTLVEQGRGIIAREDRDAATRMRELLSREGVEFRTGFRAERVERTSGGTIRVVIAPKDPSRPVPTAGTQLPHPAGPEETIESEMLFIATGRQGNSENLGLEEAGVKLDRGCVVVDRYLRTNVPGIWACGDVKGSPQFTHFAAYEAVKLVRNLLFPGQSPVSYDAIPWCVYTDPELARVGPTEAEAAAMYGAEKIRTFRIEMADVDRAVTDRTAGGLVKLITRASGEILAAHLLCANASSMIGMLVLAKKKRVKIGELAQLVSPYPSLTDAIQKAATQHYERLGRGLAGRVARFVVRWTS